MSNHHLDQSRPAPLRQFGALLGVGSTVMVVFMAMHPSPHAHDAAGLVVQLTNEAGFIALVHGVLMAAMVAVTAGVSGLCELDAMNAAAARTGVLLFGAGSMTGVLAATINGFILPAVVAHRSSDAPEVIDKLKPVMSLCFEGNRVLSQLSVIGASSGVLLLSVALCGRGQSRRLGAGGVVCGLAPLAALSAGSLPMNVHGFGAFVLVQSGWCLWAAVRMMTGRI